MTSQDNPLTAIMDRISSPITGTYILSWVVFNWELSLVTFLSGYDAEYKIKWALGYISQHPIAIFLGPLIFTALYLLSIPHLREFYSSYSYRRKLESKSRDMVAERNLEDLRTFGQTMTNITADLVRTMQELKKENDHIRNEIKQIGANNFTSVDVEQISKAAQRSTSLIDSKLQDFVPLFDLKYSNFTVQDQVNNLKRVMKLK